MEDASVLFEVQALKKNIFDIEFKGNYTFYNTNVTQSIILGAPFGFEKDYNLTDIEIIVNDTLIPYEIVRISEEEHPQWRDFLGWRFDSRTFIINNITFHMDSLTRVSHSFSVYIDSGSAINDIVYDVGTSRAWTENVTETVDFRVQGIQPDYYSSGCIKTKIENGTSYSWQWINTVILEENVGISYDKRSFYERNLVGFILFYIVGIPTIVLVSIIAIVIVLARKKYKAGS
jgi:hypothetical protein